MRSTSSSLIFENSTRNKKLSMRLSESITLFSFIAPLGSVWAFLLFLFKSRSFQVFLTHSSLSHLFWGSLTQRSTDREWNYDHDFTLYFWRITKDLWSNLFSLILTHSASFFSFSHSPDFQKQSEGNDDKKSCHAR